MNHYTLIVRVEGLGDWGGAAQPPTGKYYPSTIIAHSLDFRTKNFRVHETTVYTPRPLSAWRSYC